MFPHRKLFTVGSFVMTGHGPRPAAMPFNKDTSLCSTELWPAFHIPFTRNNLSSGGYFLSY